MDGFFSEYGAVLFWGIIAIATLIVEACTADMVSVWFTPGAIVAAVLSIWVNIFWLQLLVFLALSAIFLVLTRRYFRKHPMTSNGESLNADAIIGKTGIVQDAINNTTECGSVKVGSLVWTARATDSSASIPQGTVVVVREIKGVKLICEPVSESTNQTI